MSGRFACTAWAHAHASSRGLQSPDFTPTLRASGLPGALRLAAHPGQAFVQLQKDFEQVLKQQPQGR